MSQLPRPVCEVQEKRTCFGDLAKRLGEGIMWVRGGGSLKGVREATFQIGFFKIHLGLHNMFLERV